VRTMRGNVHVAEGREYGRLSTGCSGINGVLARPAFAQAALATRVRMSAEHCSRTYVVPSDAVPPTSVRSGCNQRNGHDTALRQA